MLSLKSQRMKPMASCEFPALAFAVFICLMQFQFCLFRRGFICLMWFYKKRHKWFKEQKEKLACS